MDWSSLLVSDILRHHIFGGSILSEDSDSLLQCRLVCRFWNHRVVLPHIRFAPRYSSNAPNLLGDLISLLSNKCRAATISLSEYPDADTQIFTALHNNTTLTTLTFSNMSLDGAKNFQTLLQTNRTIKSLIFNASDLRSNGNDYISQLATCLAENSSPLQELCFRRTEINVTSASQLFSAISTNVSLKSLSLGRFQFDPTEFDNLVSNVLISPANITKLHITEIPVLRHNHLIFDSICRLVTETTRIKSLAVSPLNELDFIPFFESLSSNKSDRKSVV